MPNEIRLTVRIEEDPATGEAVLPFPEELISELGWVAGDKLRWRDLGDGRWEIVNQTRENGKLLG